MHIVKIFALVIAPIITSVAQIKTTEHNNQFWVGYLSTVAISNKFSLWNDFHYVPQGFGILRTGLTRNFSNSSITAGYAFAWLNAGQGSKSLGRKEQRPWAQLQFNLPVNPKTFLIQRLRYEARFRQNIDNGEVVDGYTFTNRIRFMMTLKRTLGRTEDKSTVPFIMGFDEVMLNFGENVYSTFDQNRIYLGFGLQRKTVQYQLGFMNRYVQAAPGSYVLNHTLVIWVFHQLDLRKLAGKKNKIAPAIE